jgi:competence protein ComFC
MYSLLQNLAAYSVDLLFPPVCGACGEPGSFICRRCRQELRDSQALSGERAGADGSLAGALGLYAYKGAARSLVLALKYRSLHALAAPMGELLADYFIAHPLPVDLVMPVPLHSRRRRQRGFNQSELLARPLARRAALELDARSLQRIRNTSQQTRTDSREQREENVRAAFRCRIRPEGRRVLLVDDVLTTGATLRECARTLRAAGAASVCALAFCHEG